MIYVASPYTNPDPAIQEFNYVCARSYTARLIAMGNAAFSPIVHSHELAKTHELPGDAQFWMDWNLALLSKCHTLHVLRLKDWEKSVGVHFEIGAASALGLHIEYIDP